MKKSVVDFLIRPANRNKTCFELFWVFSEKFSLKTSRKNISLKNIPGIGLVVLGGGWIKLTENRGPRLDFSKVPTWNVGEIRVKNQQGGE